jgi:phosphatidylglycerophosphate synthase
MAKKKSKQECADCWSPSERRMKAHIERLKNLIFFPIIRLLVKLGVTANMVSYSSAVIGLASAVYLWYDIKVAAILLAVSFAIDGLDGSVARATKKNKMKGSVTDCFADQLTISATTIGFIAVGLLNPVIGGLYLIVYPVIIIFSILRNIIGKPAVYVLRPRLVVFIAFWFYAATSINWMNYVVLPLSIILLFQAVKDFYFLRGNLK